MSSYSYEMVRDILKPPVHMLAITFDNERPSRAQFDLEFATLEEAYDAFREKMPYGRWTVWLKGAGGKTIGLDSQLWEKVMGKRAKE